MNLGVRFSHPNWLVYRWLQRYPDAIEDLLTNGITRGPFILYVSTLLKFLLMTSRQQLDAIGCRLGAGAFP